MYENFTQNPLREILSPYLNSILGTWFYGIVFFFIAAAVYIKTRSVVSTSAVMLIITTLFSGVFVAGGASIYTLAVFFIMAAISITALIVGIITGR